MFIFSLSLALAVSGGSFRCDAPYFHDGDDIRCGGRTMRLAAIDAPELPGSPKCRRPGRHSWCDFPLGFKSRNHIRSLAARGPIDCARVAPDDRYGRPIVRCAVEGRDLGAAQMRAGLARAWP
jgi:endonuclease YncB( thermonuclease family)